MFVNIMQRFHQFRQHRRLLTVYFNIPLSPEKKKKAQILQYTFVVSTVLKKAVYTAQFLSSTPTHTHNTFKVAHLHIHKNIYDKTKRLDLVPNNQMIRGLPLVTVIHEIQEVFGTKLVTEKT